MIIIIMNDDVRLTTKISECLLFNMKFDCFSINGGFISIATTLPSVPNEVYLTYSTYFFHVEWQNEIAYYVFQGL